MRFSAVVISTAFVLAGTTAALSMKRENILAARFADSDSLVEVDAREYDEPKLYARGGAISKLTGGGKKKDNPPSYQEAARDPPPRYEASPNHPPHLDSFQRETDYSNNPKTPAYTSTSGRNANRHKRRSYYGYDGLVARGNGMPNHRRRSFYDLD